MKKMIVSLLAVLVALCLAVFFVSCDKSSFEVITDSSEVVLEKDNHDNYPPDFYSLMSIQEIVERWNATHPPEWYLDEDNFSKEATMRIIRESTRMCRESFRMVYGEDFQEYEWKPPTSIEKVLLWGSGDQS